MRNAFCSAMVEAAADPRLVFLTGDLGFAALEPLREALGRRFINAGVAEQNMVSTAAGLARSGMRPWVYSIAPFVYARPFEQIRNDVCLHDLPVVMVGNGGGYGYGVMGATHHALEDYGTLLTLQGLRAFIPAFDADLVPIVKTLLQGQHPSYFRLGLSEPTGDIRMPPYAPWRRLLEGDAATIVVVGPLVGGILTAAATMEVHRRPAVWLLSELPFDDFPTFFLEDVKRSDHLVVVEEHSVHGGAGQILAQRLLTSGNAPRRFTHRAAAGYPSGRYGSQKFHRKESGLDPASVLAAAIGRVSP